MTSKSIITVMICVLITVMISGCGNSAQTSQNKTNKKAKTSKKASQNKPMNKNLKATITVALPGGDTLKYFKSTILPGFKKKYPNIKVNLSEATNNGQLATQIAAGNPPDINDGVWGYEPAKYAKLGKLVDLSKMPGAKKVFGTIDSKFLVKNFGGVYYLPWNATTTMMIYNKNLFKKAGLDPNKPPKTTRQFLEDAKKISALPKNSDGQKIYGTIFWNDVLNAGGWYWPMLAPIYYNINGGKEQLLNKFGTGIVFNKPDAKLAQFYQFAKKAQQYAPPTMKKNFFNRNIGMWLQFGYGWENNLSQAKGKPMKIGKDVGVAPVPVAKAGMKPWSSLNGRSLEVFKTTKKREQASWALVKYLMSKKVNLAADKALHQLPTLKSLETNPAFQTPETKPFVKQAQHALVVQPYANTDVAENAVLGAYQKAVVKHSLTPKQAVKDAAKTAKAKLK